MSALNWPRDARLASVRLLLIGGLLLLTAIIGLQWQRLPLTMLLAGLGGLLLAILIERDMPLALSLFVAGAGVVALSIGTGTMSRINAGMLMIGLFSAVWILKMLVTRRVRLADTPLNRPILAFLVAALVSFFFGLAISGLPSGLKVAGLTVQLGQYAVFLLIAGAFLLGANHPLSERSLQGWTLFLGAAGIAVMLINLGTGSFSILPHWTGALYMWPVVLLAGQALFNGSLPRWARAVGLGALGLWGLWVLKIALSYKSIFVPAAVAFLILLFVKSRRLFLAVVVVLAIAAIAYGPARIDRALNAGERYSAMPVRSSLWADVFRLGAQSPILGLGPANYIYYWSESGFQSLSYEHANKRAWTRRTYAPPAHNMFADLFAETGVVGLILFCWVLGAGLWLGWRTLKRPLSPFARGYAAAVLAGFAAQIVASWFFAEWLLPYVYNLGFANFPQAAYSWLLLGTLAWLGMPQEEGRRESTSSPGDDTSGDVPAPLRVVAP